MEAPFKKGDRIKLVRMGSDDPCPMEPGATGTVTHCEYQETFKSSQVTVDWDSGRGLMLCVPPDVATKIQ